MIPIIDDLTIIYKEPDSQIYWYRSHHDYRLYEARDPNNCKICTLWADAIPKNAKDERRIAIRKDYLKRIKE